METKKLTITAKSDKFGKALMFGELSGWHKVIDDKELNKFWEEAEKGDVIMVEFDDKLIGDMYFEKQKSKAAITTPQEFAKKVSEMNKIPQPQANPFQSRTEQSIAFQNVIKACGSVYHGNPITPKDFANICKEVFKELYGVEFK